MTTPDNARVQEPETSAPAAPAGKGRKERKERKRSGLVRWQGIAVFFAVCALLAAFWLLFLNGLTERAVEKTGAAIVGAEVDLDAARVSLSPLGVTLSRLQVTNPNAPATNIFEAGRISFHMDGPNALRHKIIVDEMRVEGVKLNSPRRTPGFVAKSEGPSVVQQLMELPSFVIPNVKEVFEEEKAGLPSLQLITGAVDRSEKARAKWDGKVKELKAAADPDKYQKMYEELKARKGKASLGNILGGAKDVVALQKQVRADLKVIASAKDEFSADAGALRQIVTDAPGLVAGDARKLIEKYSLTSSGLANISRLLFGGKIAGQVSSALRWNDRLAPLIDRIKTQVKGKDVVKPLRAKGMDVRFREDNPLPDFLARLVSVSISLPAGDFAGRIENLTPDQDILGRPLKFRFSGENLKGLKSALIEGVFDRTRPATRKDVLDIRVRGFRASGLTLSTSQALPVTMTEGLVDLDVGATLEKGTISARIAAGLRGIRLAVEQKAARQGLAGRVDAAIRTALLSVSNLNVSAEVTGAEDNFDVKVRSDIDDLLKNAVGAVVRDQMAGLERDLKAAISDRISEPLAKLGAGVKGLDACGLELDGLTKRLNDLLKKWK
ncbi:MAG TPA: TIGR03545 family protein [Candidatus Aminicenantes bacterium]|nr:TIGR03545 family protein [Candidatus Aminicenantes bacterium]HRY64778.1 TIGR03545 family protein [Candidatus Aminicenantes bacterium]HRZ71691.1 TIGR03545 family protein [Candidatus Aminicenantes bacterium]